LLYTSMTLAELGDVGAEPLARELVDGLPAAGRHEDRALAWATIGRTQADRDPGAAADAGLRALEATRAWPSTPVEDRVRRLHANLAARHRGVAEVARLGHACGALRPAHDV
jgi:hypothetical protein